MIIIITDRYNSSGDCRDACTLVGQGLHHISLKLPRTRRLYRFKLLLEMAAYLDTSNQNNCDRLLSTKVPTAC